ncbi:MAG: hypothetical protein IT370_02580 [Deltaproteobacteria bacterium]|nr:hypothetical protein [Deltaproteobacteria bacterium]
MRSSLLITVLWLAGLGGCGSSADDDDDAADAAVLGMDAAVVAADAALPDASQPGADAARPDGAAGACHGESFGAPAVPLRMVATLPGATGGSIPPGAYDAVDAQTTGSTTGTFRSTWFFAGTQLDVFEQLTLTGTPPTPVPRSFSFSTATGNRLLRTGICMSTSSFDNEYSVRTVGVDTFLDVKQATIMFTFKKRP